MEKRYRRIAPWLGWQKREREITALFPVFGCFDFFFFLEGETGENAEEEGRKDGGREKLCKILPAAPSRRLGLAFSPPLTTASPLRPRELWAVDWQLAEKKLLRRLPVFPIMIYYKRCTVYFFRIVLSFLPILRG